MLESTALDQNNANKQVAVGFIDLANIRPNPSPVRVVDKDSEQFHELVASIAKNGIIQPIAVRPSSTNDGTYLVVAGNNRYFAALEAGLVQVPAIVNQVSELEATGRALQENIHRKQMTMAEVAATVLQLTGIYPTWGLAEIAGYVSKPVQYVTDCLKLNKLPEDLRKQILDRGITASNVAKLVGLADVNDIPSFLEDAATDDTLTFGAKVANRNAQVRAAKQQGKAPAAREFIPTPKGRPIKFIQSVLDSGAEISKLASLLGVSEEAVVAVLKFTISLDEPTLAKAKAEYDAKRAAEAAAKEAAASERKKKAADKILQAEMAKLNPATPKD
jgi:ParB/RepB/Spo0J family partition protein